MVYPHRRFVIPFPAAVAITPDICPPAPSVLSQLPEPGQKHHHTLTRRYRNADGTPWSRSAAIGPSCCSSSDAFLRKVAVSSGEGSATWPILTYSCSDEEVSEPSSSRWPQGLSGSLQTRVNPTREISTGVTLFCRETIGQSARATLGQR